MDEQIKAAAVLVRPDTANLTPERFLIPFRASLGDDIRDVRWLVHVVLLRLFGLQQRAATLAFAENGGVQAESGLAGTRNATRSACPSAQSRLSFWVEPTCSAPRARSPLSHGASTTIYDDIYDEGFRCSLSILVAEMR